MRETEFEVKTLSLAEQRLLETLGELSQSIAFCVSGSRAVVLPGLNVAGVGEIALPVSKSDARRMIKKSSQAPYGRGEDTIVDAGVRRVWQLEPDQFDLNNTNWQPFIREIVNSVKGEFGIKQKVTASLYKLLLYEKGSFFVPHRDTEKSHRMFATLVVCLPAMHEGGLLVVSHGGHSHVVDFSDKGSAYDLKYAAFYADCEHEVRPVTDGYRICLVYNLSTGGRKKQPTVPEFTDAIETATRSIKTIFEDDDERDMIILPLMHQYSEAGLAPEALDGIYGKADAEGYDEEWDEEGESEEESKLLYSDEEEDSDEGEWNYEAPGDTPVPRRVGKSPNASVSNLGVPLEFKGADRARIGVLNEAAARSGCRAFVALLTHWQTGHPDYGTIDYAPYGYHRDYYRADLSEQNPHAEFEEVFDESLSLKHWHSLDGTRQPFDELTIDADDIVRDEAKEDRLFRQEIHEATGNAGMSMERWYHQAVVVLWPESRHFHVLASQGCRNSVPALEDLVNRTTTPQHCKDCRLFAERILDSWTFSTESRRGEKNSLGTRMMRSLLAIADSRLAIKFFEQVLPLEYPTLDGDTLVALADLTEWNPIEKQLLRFFHAQKADEYRADLRGLVSTFGSMSSLGNRPAAARKQVCKSMLKAVTAMLKRWESRRTSDDRQEFVGTVEPLVRGICLVGTKADVSNLLGRIADKPKRYDLHSVLIPAVKLLAADEHFMSSAKLAESALHELRQFCIDQLKERTAKKPTPPKNWKRNARLGCDCTDCKELAQFLKDKNSPVHRFPRRTDLRQHLHRQIDQHRIDCAHVTERCGRPYTLVCTKNQATFERNLKQFETDCTLLSELLHG